MNEARFQPRGFLKFDLERGQLSSRDEKRYLLVPAELISALGDDADLNQAARAWGEEQGAALAALIGEAVLREAPEQFVTELSHLLAALGWGACDLETWGEVAFVIARNSPAGGSTSILGPFLAGVFSAVGPERFECVRLPEPERVRFLLTGADTASEVRRWADQGADVEEIVRKMHAGEHLSSTHGSR